MATEEYWHKHREFLLNSEHGPLARLPMTPEALIANGPMVAVERALSLLILGGNAGCAMVLARHSGNTVGGDQGGVVSTSSAFAKLNLKEQAEIVVLHAPARFEAELGRLKGVAVRRALPRRGPCTSKRYKCDFNRDTGWAVLGAAGFEGVRLVAIDEDWSAMRFRRVEFIKSLTRTASRICSTMCWAEPD